LLLTLSETESSLKTKINQIFTGGRETKKEQLALGGRPEICRAFDLFRFFFMENDAELVKHFQKCKAGSILCGECKRDLQSRILKFIAKHQERKEGMIDYAKQILEP
jgi:tryptophanyl-tRNA synthetase